MPETPDSAETPPRPVTPRSIELEVEVPGTPEEVWWAIATGPGISSWYVPHVVEERAGGAATASFGPGPEMQIHGRVAAWEPLHRVVFDKGEDGPGLAFEWLLQARDDGTCVVRLVNTGFGDGEPWDDQYDDMHEGWLLFLSNLRLHLQHFAGHPATPALPMAYWPIGADSSWNVIADHLHLQGNPQVGDRVTLDPGDGPRLTGTVIDTVERRLILLIDEPTPGTAFVVAEGHTATALSVWAYLYGERREELAAEFTTSWQRWLDAHAPAPSGDKLK